MTFGKLNIFHVAFTWLWHVFKYKITYDHIQIWVFQLFIITYKYTIVLREVREIIKLCIYCLIFDFCFNDKLKWYGMISINNIIIFLKKKMDKPLQLTENIITSFTER